MKISERSNPVGYQAALVSAALRSGVAHDAPDADLDQAATTAGLRPPALTESREAVRYALECPVDFMDVRRCRRRHRHRAGPVRRRQRAPSAGRLRRRRPPGRDGAAAR
ncbi:hypothetical protein ABZ379_33245 [Streptomyces canus]|uniref:hypothetical protein n=1 Tax=Streptomyces canus TaxID=58343 RepID=UPI0033E34E86